MGNPLDAIKAAEQARDKALADASIAYVAEIDRADDEYRVAPQKAEEAYRQRDVEIRAAYAKAIKDAEDKKLADSQRSYDEHANAPDKARATRDAVKLQARENYNATKTSIEAAFKAAVFAAQQEAING